MKKGWHATERAHPQWVGSESYRFLAALRLVAFRFVAFLAAFFLAAFFFAISRSPRVATAQPQTTSLIVTTGGLSRPPSYQM